MAAICHDRVAEQNDRIARVATLSFAYSSQEKGYGAEMHRDFGVYVESASRAVRRASKFPQSNQPHASDRRRRESTLFAKFGDPN